MIHETIKSFLDAAVSSTTKDISKYTLHPKVDLSRNKKLPADELLSFLISQGSSGTKNELLDFFLMAADGSTFTFFSRPCFASEEYLVSGSRSAKGFYSMHLNAFYDLVRHTYTDAIIQPVHEKDEFKAFCDVVDRHEILPGTKNVYIGDRGYCSYNNMAHVMEQGQYFMFRTKDITSKGLVANFVFQRRLPLISRLR